MKLSANPLVAIAATMLSVFAQPASASIKHEPHFVPAIFKTSGEPVKAASFSIQLNRQGDEKRVRLVIENPGRKNLYVSLNGPDGSPIDDFFTGRKLVKMSKLYNFSIAEAGLYSIEVRYGSEKIKKQIRLEYSGDRPLDKLTVE